MPLVQTAHFFHSSVGSQQFAATDVQVI